MLLYLLETRGDSGVRVEERAELELPRGRGFYPGSDAVRPSLSLALLIRHAAECGEGASVRSGSLLPDSLEDTTGLAWSTGIWREKIISSGWARVVAKKELESAQEDEGNWIERTWNTSCEIPGTLSEVEESRPITTRSVDETVTCWYTFLASVAGVHCYWSHSYSISHELRT